MQVIVLPRAHISRSILPNLILELAIIELSSVNGGKSNHMPAILMNGWYMLTLLVVFMI